MKKSEIWQKSCSLCKSLIFFGIYSTPAGKRFLQLQQQVDTLQEENFKLETCEDFIYAYLLIPTMYLMHAFDMGSIWDYIFWFISILNYFWFVIDPGVITLFFFAAKDDMRIKFDVLTKECAELKQKVGYSYFLKWLSNFWLQIQ